MKTSSAKAKARRLQNLVAEKLRETFPTLQEADVRPALMGESGIDIKLSTAARVEIPYGIEAKNVERLNIWSAISQGEANAKSEGLTPAVVLSRNRLPEPYVAIPLHVFLRLIQLESKQVIKVDNSACLTSPKPIGMNSTSTSTDFPTT